MNEELAGAVNAIEATLLGDAPSLTKHEVAARAGVPVEIAEELWHQLGFVHVGDDDAAFSPRDVEALTMSLELVSLGILSEDSQSALVRTWGRSFARLADWQVSLLAGLALEGPDPAARLGELTDEVMPRIEMLQAYVWRRHLASAAARQLSDGAASDNVLLSVCFVDIVGYTSRSKALDESELVEWIERFERETTGLVVEAGGSVIKTIGDEILFTLDDPVAAVRIALELTARGDDADDPFPPVRAGIAHGLVVRRLGDVFGPVVNIAARLTSVARPGTVVVDAATHQALSGGEADGTASEASQDAGGYGWRRLRRLSVKGYSRLEAWVVRPPA